MLLNTTYSDKEVTKQISDAIGDPYSFMNRLKMRGIGSRRMVIEGIAEEYSNHLKADIYQTYANIELRPRGLLIHFRDKLETLALGMSFKRLTTRFDGSLALSSCGKFIEFDEQELDRKLVNCLMKLVPASN